jgi:hypothetical protein
MLYTNETASKGAERNYLACMMRAFLDAGRKVEHVATPEPKPLPPRAAWIDPETVLKRKPRPAKKAEAPPIGFCKPRDARPAPTLERQKEVLLRCAAEGMSMAAAGRELGVCERTARRAAKALGIDFAKYNFPKLSDDEVARQAAVLFADGHGLSATASRIGCGKYRLLRIAFERGLERKESIE